MKRMKFLMASFLAFPLAAWSRLSASGYGAAGEGFKISAGEARYGRHFKMKGVTLNLLDLKISSGDSGGAISVFEQNGFTPDGGPPMHIHLFQDEFFFIIEGVYLFQVGEERHSMKPGDTIFLPRNVPHAFVQLTEKSKVLVSYMPAGKMEDFFKVTDSWVSPPTPEQITRAFEDHDMKITGPPIHQ